MCDDAWVLKEIGDFIYLLNCHAPDEKDVLQRRFKKDMKSFKVLYELLGQLDGLGFDSAMKFGRDTKRIKTIVNNKHLSLIEIRVGKTLWRVITYVDDGKKVLVMIDAFEHHKAKSMNKAVEEVEGKVRIAMKLLEEVE